MPSAAPWSRSNRASAAVHDAAGQNAGPPRRRDDPQGFGAAADEGAPRRRRGRLDEARAETMGRCATCSAALGARSSWPAAATTILDGRHSHARWSRASRAAARCPARPHQRFVRRGVAAGRASRRRSWRTRSPSARARGSGMRDARGRDGHAGARRPRQLGFGAGRSGAPLAFFKYGTRGRGTRMFSLLDMAAGLRLFRSVNRVLYPLFSVCKIVHHASRARRASVNSHRAAASRGRQLLRSVGRRQSLS